MADGFTRLAGKLAQAKKKPGPGNKITEDDPRWNPATMGNKRWGGSYVYTGKEDGLQRFKRNNV